MPFVRHLGKTNMLTNIPEDIKLELKNGVLTLKAGSKVYVPNGFEADGVTPKFDVVVIASDISQSFSGTERDLIVFVDTDTMVLTYYNNAKESFSGSSTPTLSTNYGVWYNTTENIIKSTNDKGASWSVRYLSLPILICHQDSSSAITSIDQVFNGFGYIGSTVFALPNVKGLIPDGKNPDGSLKNIEFTVDKVITATRNYNTTRAQTVNITNAGKSLWFANGYVKSISIPTTNNYILWYNPKENVLRYNNSNTSVTDISQYPIVNDMLHVATTGTGDGTSKITSFNPKKVGEGYVKNKCYSLVKNRKTYYKYGTEPNVTVVGSPTIVDGVVSGFSASQYLVVSNDFNYGQNFEMVAKIVASTSTDYQAVFGGKDFGLFLGLTKDGLVHFNAGNGGSWAQGIYGTEVLTSGTAYFIKGVRNQNTLTAYHSVNGVDWVLDGTMSTDYSTSGNLTIGVRGDLNHVFKGSIDLSQSYININGKDWWHGTKAVESTKEDFDYYTTKIIAYEPYFAKYETVSQTFSVGNLQTYIVPDNVTKLNVVCSASRGANSEDGSILGGSGGSVKCDLSVTPGQTLYITVGGIPSSAGTPSYNASDIRIFGTGLENRIIVAGGGGSSYTDNTLCDNVVHLQGVNNGEGYVKISYIKELR